MSEKIFQCNLCDYKCKQNSDLKRHKANVHDIDVKWFRCDICDYKCKQNSNLKQHKADIHDIDVKWFRCDLCNFKCKTNGDLKKHKMRIHNINITWIYCNLCDFKCKTNGELKQHKDFHLNYYQCPVCNRKISGLKEFRDHFKRNNCYVISGYATRKHEHCKRYLIEFIKQTWNPENYQTEYKIGKNRVDIRFECKEGYTVAFDHTLHQSKSSLKCSVLSKFKKGYEHCADYVYIIVFYPKNDIEDIINELNNNPIKPVNISVIHYKELFNKECNSETKQKYLDIFTKFEHCNLQKLKENVNTEIPAFDESFFEQKEVARVQKLTELEKATLKQWKQNDYFNEHFSECQIQKTL